MRSWRRGTAPAALPGYTPNGRVSAPAVWSVRQADAMLTFDGDAPRPCPRCKARLASMQDDSALVIA